MDASLLCLDSTNHKFTYSSANNPIWVIRENNCQVLKFPGKLSEVKSKSQMMKMRMKEGCFMWQ